MRMPGLVFRLWVLLLAVLLQVGSLGSGVTSYTSASSAPPPVLGDFDTHEEEDGSEELSAVDDNVGNDVLLSGSSCSCSPAPSCRCRLWSEGLLSGGPPSDTPDKPPRS